MTKEGRQFGGLLGGGDETSGNDSEAHIREHTERPRYRARSSCHAPLAPPAVTAPIASVPIPRCVAVSVSRIVIYRLRNHRRSGVIAGRHLKAVAPIVRFCAKRRPFIVFDMPAKVFPVQEPG